MLAYQLGFYQVSYSKQKLYDYENIVHWTTPARNDQNLKTSYN